MSKGQDGGDTDTLIDSVWGIRALQIISAVLLSAVAGVLLYYCYLEQFQVFMEYDDEGYVLLTLRQFMQGLPLYDGLFTQYGPFHFVLRGLFHLITFSSVTHDTTRLISLAIRTFAGITCAYFFFAATRHALMAVLLYIHFIVFFGAVVNEPGHPQETVLLLLCLMLWTVSLAAGRLPLRHALLIGGLVGGALLLTKINIGAFFCLSCLTIPLCATPKSRWDGGIRLLIAGSVLTIPFQIMRRHAFSGTFNYFSLATVSMFLVLATNLQLGGKLQFKRAWAGLYFLGMAIIMAITLIPVFLTGTTIRALITGLVMNPAKFSSQYVNLPLVPTAGIVTTLVMAALGITYLFSNTLLGLSTAQTQKFVAAMKIGFGLYGAYLTLHGPAAILAFIPGALWLLPAGLNDREYTTRSKIVRLFLMNLAVFQILQAYPVAGSQAIWAAFPLLLTCYFLLHDGWASFSETHAVRPGLPRMGRIAVMAAASAAMLLLFCDNLPDLISRFRLNSRMMLPGSSMLHITAPLKTRYEYLTSNIRARCDTLVTMPGLGSLNVWSGVAPPTGWNVTAWVVSIDNEKQQAVVEKLRQSSRPCAVACEGCLNWWLRGQDISGEPLVRYIRSELVSFTPVEGFELRIPEKNKPRDGSRVLLSGETGFNGKDQVFNVAAEALYKRAPVTIRMWFRSAAPGGLLGAQAVYYSVEPAADWAPLLYIGSDGKVHGGFFTRNAGVQNTTGGPVVTDQRWHHVVLVKQTGEQALYVDGSLVGKLGAPEETIMRSFQLGAVYARGWPSGNEGWLRLQGTIREALVFDGAWLPEDVTRDLAASKPQAYLAGNQVLTQTARMDLPKR
jgi:hypothetical protein